MSDQLEDAPGGMHPAVVDLVEEVRDLPMSMSATLPAVIDACDNGDTSVNDLTNLVSADQSLSAMLLKLANSAYYGYSRRIETLPEAIVLLGFSTIKSLAITTTTMNLLFQSSDDLSEIRNDIWLHSLATGVASRAIARKYNAIHAEKAFLAGLLHDFGVIILSVYRKDDFMRIISDAQDRGVSYEQAELDLLGYTHGDLGSCIAEAWKFPTTHCEAIRFHHSPNQATLKPILTHVTHLADWLVMDLGIGTLVATEQPEPNPRSLAALKITSNDLPELKEELQKLFDESGEFGSDSNSSDNQAKKAS